MSEFDNLELNINKYHIDELKEMFSLDNDYTKQDVVQKVTTYVDEVKNTNNNNSTPIITFFNEVANKLIENIHFNEKLNSHLNSINLTENDNTLILNNPEKQNIKTITNDNRYANPDFIIHNQNETLESIQISFTSDFRKKIYTGTVENTSTSNFTIDLPDIITDVVSMELLSSEIPLLDYNFSSLKFNNQFKINIIDTSYGITEEVIINIPDGIWNSTQFVSYINDNYLGKLIIDPSTNNNINEYLRYLTIEYNNYKGNIQFRFKTLSEIDQHNTTYGASLSNTFDFTKFTYTLSNVYNEYNTIENYSLTALGTIGYGFNDIYQNMNIKYYGINNTKSFGLINYLGVAEASYVFNLNNNTLLYVSVNDYQSHQNNAFLAVANDGFIPKNIISKIQLTTNVFTSNISNDQNSSCFIRKYFSPVKIFRLNIQILNKFGNIVDLKNFPTSFVFKLTRKKDTN